MMQQLQRTMLRRVQKEMKAKSDTIDDRMVDFFTHKDKSILQFLDEKGRSVDAKCDSMRGEMEDHKKHIDVYSGMVRI